MTPLVTNPPPPATITRNYRIWRNWGLGATEAQNTMNQVERLFRDNFAINLVRVGNDARDNLAPRPGCNRNAETQFCAYSSIARYNCGLNNRCHDLHHRSGTFMLSRWPGSSTTMSFKFVNYMTCFWEAPRHDRVHGLASVSPTTFTGHHMLVSTQSPNALRTAVHEVSHVFGAHGHEEYCTPGQPCVMRNNALIPVHNQWCAHHRNQILARRHL